MDYETLTNCFVAVFIHYKEEEQKVFVVHKSKNDFYALWNFLHACKEDNEWHVSFNGLAFDSQITEYILRQGEQLIDLPGDEIAKAIYRKAQNVIERSNNNEFSEYPEWKLSVPQIDLYKLNHWDNNAKRSSLKWIEYSMDWHNVQEMPIHHTTVIETQDQINSIISYCINDVLATKKILHLSKEQIALRKNLTEEYNINLYSASEPRISKELFASFLSEALGMKKAELKSLRTRRGIIAVKDIILDYVKFNRKEFQNLLEKFKSLNIDASNTKGAFKYTMTHKGVKTDFGFGGVHGANKAGIYQSQDGMIIMTSDVTSFYPNLAIRNKWSPAHLPKKIFCDQYEWFFEERKKIPKKDPKNYVYKIILNSTYGLSNDENSFLYDPEFTMRITMNGQLSLMMLYEMLSDAIPGSIPIMQNTDGLEMMIPETYKAKYLEICDEWEKITNLQLEHDQYDKLVLGDVNNYIAVYSEKEVSKEDWESIMKKSPHYVFIDDFCAGAKIKGDWYFIETCFRSNQRYDTELQHIVRYYISNRGCKIIKHNKIDKRQIQLEAGKWMQTVYNVHDEKPFAQYDINEDYYLQNIYKEIEHITKAKQKSQLSLF